MDACRTDQTGRLLIPAAVLAAIGIGPEERVAVERTAEGLLVRRMEETPITARIAALNLPVADWDVMKGEIEAGRLACLND